MSALLTLYLEAYVCLFNTQEHAAGHRRGVAYTERKVTISLQTITVAPDPPAHILYRKSHLIPIHYVNYPNCLRTICRLIGLSWEKSMFQVS